MPTRAWAWHPNPACEKGFSHELTRSRCPAWILARVLRFDASPSEPRKNLSPDRNPHDFLVPQPMNEREGTRRVGIGEWSGGACPRERGHGTRTRRARRDSRTSKHRSRCPAWILARVLRRLLDYCAMHAHASVVMAPKAVVPGVREGILARAQHPANGRTACLRARPCSNRTGTPVRSMGLWLQPSGSTM